MKPEEIKEILHRYFEAETTLEEEKLLAAYFNSGHVNDELKDFIPYFGGITELIEKNNDSAIEDDVMSYILEQETQEKSKYRWLWQTVTGIAASVIIILSGYLIYQNQNKSFKDTFTNPEEACMYAKQTLQYVSAKYNKGLVEMNNFGKIEKASQSLKKGIKPLNDFIYGIEKMKREQTGKN
jgi:hypothetical protein